MMQQSSLNDGFDEEKDKEKAVDSQGDGLLRRPDGLSVGVAKTPTLVKVMSG